MIPVVVDLVTSLTVTSTEEASALDETPAHGPRHVVLETLANLVRQAPAAHAERERLLRRLGTDVDESVPTPSIATAAYLLRTRPPRYPEPGTMITLPALDAPLTEALATLLALDRTVAEPWTLVGGLMVMLHAVEHGVPFSRATSDADVAVGVFTHRAALQHVTRALRDLGFADATPTPLASDAPLSYRWRRDGVHVDLMVPPGVNDQDSVPRTVTRRPAVELPATQQALARSERPVVRTADGTEGHLRRPNLLGAVTMKAAALAADRRDPRRHAADVVVLCDALAVSGLHVTYVAEMRPKDRARLRAAATTLTAADWASAGDPEAARGALDYLLGDAAPG